MRKLIDDWKGALARAPWMRDLAVWGAAFALSLAQWRHVVAFFTNDLVANVLAERGVLEGYPHWRYFQSRVLGPGTEQLLHLLFGVNYLFAHMIVAIIVLALCGVVMFYLGRAIGGRQSGWSAMLAFHVLFAMTMARPWLYIWDYYILLVGAIFLLLVIHRAPWWSFLLLMSWAFFNHESALFIGVWMIAKALVDAWIDRCYPDWKMLAGGVLGGLAGQVLIEVLRRSLLKREIGWEIFTDVGTGPTSPFDAYFHVQIFANLHDMYEWVTQPTYDFLFLIPLPLIITVVLAVMLVKRRGPRALSLSIYAMTQVAALLVLGMRAETRNLLHLVPFLCVGGILTAKPEWDRAGAPAPVQRAQPAPAPANVRPRQGHYR